MNQELNSIEKLQEIIIKQAQENSSQKEEIKYLKEKKVEELHLLKIYLE